MKNKGGLGRIPKSLAWIGADDAMVQEEVVAVKVQPEEVKEKKIVKSKAASPVVHEPNFSGSSKLVEEALQASSCQKGLPKGWTRATFILDQEINEKIKALAYWERLTVKEVIHEALTQYLQGRNVKAVPKRDRIG
jgi:hypothetical protein